MCVVALALNQHPDWPILLVGNRDEFHARASAPLHRWDDGSGIIAGRDEVGGGTWLGVQPEHGAIVVVTNVRGSGGPDPAKRSRGRLVCDVLTGTGDHAAPHLAQIDDFNGFSLIAVQQRHAQLITNRPAPAMAPLTPGIHALANEAVGTICPRAARLAGAIQRWTASGEAPTALLDMLQDEGEPALFLRNAAYGTRCSTLVAVGANGAGTIVERRYGKGGQPCGETALAFGLKS